MPGTTLEEDPAGSDPLAPVFRLGSGAVDTTEPIPAKLATALSATRVSTAMGLSLLAVCPPSGRMVVQGSSGSLTAALDPGDGSSLVTGTEVIGSGAVVGVADLDVGTDTSELTSFSLVCEDKL